MEGAISVSQLTNIFDRIKKKRMVSEKEIKKELNDAQFRLFVHLIKNTRGIRYNIKKKVFEVEK